MQVNLRILTPEALALGVETHVCEIQLLLITMAAIKVQSSKITLSHECESKETYAHMICTVLHLLCDLHSNMVCIVFFKKRWRHTFNHHL